MKPTLLVVSGDRDRAPLAKYAFEYLEKNSKYFNVVVDLRADMNIEDIIKDRLEDLPEYLWIGFNKGECLRGLDDYLRDKKIKVIVDVADTQCFVERLKKASRLKKELRNCDITIKKLLKTLQRNNNIKRGSSNERVSINKKRIRDMKGLSNERAYKKRLRNNNLIYKKRLNILKKRKLFYKNRLNILFRYVSLRNIDIDYFIVRMREGHDDTKSLIDFQLAYYKNSKIVYAPWCIDNEMYERNMKQDIDVSMICSMGSLKFHSNRMKMGDILKDMAMDGIKIMMGNDYDNYMDILNRSKIFIVDGSNRRVMVQKYLEGAICGAMLLGEIPHREEDIFVDGVTICEIEDLGIFRDKILYYLGHEDERKKIAYECKRRILASHNMDSFVEIIDNMVIG